MKMNEIQSVPKTIARTIKEIENQKPVMTPGVLKPLMIEPKIPTTPITGQTPAPVVIGRTMKKKELEKPVKTPGVLKEATSSKRMFLLLT